MNWNTHYALKDRHAFLSASKYSWVNYTDERLDDVYANWKAAQRGTELHEMAARLINMGIKLPDDGKTLSLYVNDAIGFRMDTEVCLYYSDNSFGTADAISFRNNMLRIHDLKTGKSPASPKQLEIYVALFCFEYGLDPRKIDIELRLYQNNEVLVKIPNPEDILFLQEKIVRFDRRINETNI